MSATILAFADGGIDKKGGTGGAGVFVQLQEGRQKPYDFLRAAFPIADSPTNQMAELIAATKAIKLLRDRYDVSASEIQIHSDSAYVVNCFRDKWFTGWIKRGATNEGVWTNYAGEPVANIALWRDLMSLVKPVSMVCLQTSGLGARCWEKKGLCAEDRRMLESSFKEGLNVTFHKVKGHAGNYGNEMADQLATLAKKGQEIFEEFTLED